MLIEPSPSRQENLIKLRLLEEKHTHITACNKYETIRNALGIYLQFYCLNIHEHRPACNLETLRFLLSAGDHL